jgi:WD40 repeat protein
MRRLAFLVFALALAGCGPAEKERPGPGADQRPVADENNNLVHRPDPKYGPRERRGTSPYVDQAVFSPDSKFLLTYYSPGEGDPGSDYNPIALWEVSTGKRLWALPEKECRGGPVMAFLADGKQCLLSNRGNLEVRAAATGMLLRNFTGSFPDPQSFEMSSDQRFGVLSYSDRRAQLVDLTEGKVTRDLPQGGFVSPDGKSMVTLIKAQAEGMPKAVTLRLWRIATGERLWEIPCKDNWRAPMVFWPSGQYLAIGNPDNHGYIKSITLINAETGHEVRTLDYPADAVAFSADGRNLVAVDAQVTGKSVRWEVATGAEVVTMKTGKTIGGHGVVVSRHATLIAIAQGWEEKYEGPDIALWDTTTGQKILSFFKP